MTLLITGHTQPSKKQVTYLEQVIRRAMVHDWDILTGDDYGIDHHVARLCVGFETLCTVWGVDTIRHDHTGPALDRQILRVNASNPFSERRKLKHWLVDQADRILVIYDGRKKTIAYNTYLYAAAQEKWTRLVDLNCEIVAQFDPIGHPAP